MLSISATVIRVHPAFQLVFPQDACVLSILRIHGPVFERVSQNPGYVRELLSSAAVHSVRQVLHRHGSKWKSFEKSLRDMLAEHPRPHKLRISSQSVPLPEFPETEYSQAHWSQRTCGLIIAPKICQSNSTISESLESSDIQDSTSVSIKAMVQTKVHMTLRSGRLGG